MLKPEELRIGNWIFYKGLSCCQWEIEDFVEVEKAGILEVTKPIKLTPEWLEKFGFEGYGKYYNIDGMQIRATGFGYSSYQARFKTGQQTYFLRYIEYVHQLQNLYFALTGKELENR